MNKDDINVKMYPYLSPNVHGWDAFVPFAKANDIGDDSEDWMPWWLCWCTGFNTAMNLM